MKFFLSFPIQPLSQKVSYTDKIMMVGSCFSTEMGSKLEALKFDVLQNPTGIIYHPLVIAEVLDRIVAKAYFEESELINKDNQWISWLHHSSFAGTEPESTLQAMNHQLDYSHNYLKNGHFLFLTPATAFGYHLKTTNQLVANCHKMPAQIFTKELFSIEDICKGLSNTLHRLKKFNPRLVIVFTISPVKHYRDGIIENNISKAHIISAVHKVVTEFENVFYFPAYEIMNDELRDYRFFKNDFAHPDDTAVSYIFQKFIDFALEEGAKKLIPKIQEIIIAAKHLPKSRNSEMTKSFARRQLRKIEYLQSENPFLDFRKEINHFQSI